VKWSLSRLLEKFYSLGPLAAFWLVKIISFPEENLQENLQ
jgi:hypothetical protein